MFPKPMLTAEHYISLNSAVAIFSFRINLSVFTSLKILKRIKIEKSANKFNLITNSISELIDILKFEVVAIQFITN
jgi:hypothetical protein